ncbi:MAG: 2-oxoacid:acceptor oxidoreductase subunit alpha [Clostridiales bacterium]|jgi:2-oxoglutarate ferredoxin oxidoreductase subunit alpha|nr:2-oxoacid:acceptor oxidoreductase subunit alpha [Clostridiales bacterium]
MYNILIGGAAGQGIDTTVSVLEKAFKRSGYFVYTVRDFMSRVRGGHNFMLIRFGNEVITSHSNELDGIIALNEETVMLHKDKLKEDGFILCDSNLKGDFDAIRIAMTEKAKELGNPRVSGSISAGAILKLFGVNPEYVDEILEASIKDAYVKINQDAARFGYDSVERKYPHLGGEFRDYMLINGNQAVALGAIAAGLKFYSAYPMSPATPIMEYLSKHGVMTGVVMEQAEDEIAAINMAIGASYAGVRSMTGTSGGGFALMVEALGLSGIAEIPVVITNVMRPGPATGLPTRTEQSDLKFTISASHGEFIRMVISLRNHEDAFYQTARAFHIADKYQIPVLILSDQYLGDSTSTVEMYDVSEISSNSPIISTDEDSDYLRYRITENGISPRRIPGKGNYFVTADSDEHDEAGFITEAADVRISMVDKRMRKLDGIISELEEPEFFGDKDCDILIVGWGSTYGPIKEAVKTLNEGSGQKFGALIFGDIYPLPTKLLLEYADKADTIINVEQNATGQLADLIRETTGIYCNGSILKYDGRQITGEEIVSRLQKGGYYE